MRVLLIALLVGCASAHKNAVEDSPADKVAADKCQDVGGVLFKARNPIVNPTQTPGPSKVVVVHGEGLLRSSEQVGQPQALTVVDGDAFVCGKS